MFEISDFVVHLLDQVKVESSTKNGRNNLKKYEKILKIYDSTWLDLKHDDTDDTKSIKFLMQNKNKYLVVKRAFPTFKMDILSN